MEVEIVVDAHAVLGEGPIWNPVTERLVWVDIMRSEVHEFDPITSIDSVIQIGRHVGTVVPRQCGGLVCAVDDGFVAVDDDGQVTRLAHVEADIPTNRMNDGKCDSSGRLWAGTMPYDTVSPGVGALYRLDPDLSVHTMLRGITVSNGISWSLDDTLMYYIDSPTRHVDVFDFDADLGTISNRRVLIDMTGEIGVPDGMTVDAEGYLWVAIAGRGQVRRYAPDGRLGAPTLPTCTSHPSLSVFHHTILKSSRMLAACFGPAQVHVAYHPKLLPAKRRHREVTRQTAIPRCGKLPRNHHD